MAPPAARVEPGQLPAPAGWFTPTPPARRRFLPPGWALGALLVGYPLWWALGLGPFSWPLLALPMGAWLIAQRRLSIPRGFPLWVLFCVWVLASGVQVDTPERMAGFVLRASYYVSAGVFFLYLVNTRTRIATRTVASMIVGLWLLVVVGGYLGLLFPHVQYTSLTASLLPENIATNDFVQELVTPGFAEVQTVLGVEIPRPKAPFTFTNGWGGAMALLTPLVLGAMTLAEIRPSRRIIKIGLAASVVPMVLSLNRGLWVLLALGVLYAAIRQRRTEASRSTLLVLLGLVVVSALGAATPLGDPVRAALDTRTADSDLRRTILYEETIERTMESPLLGYGAPRPSERTNQSVGSHGQIWTVIFSHGFVAAGLYAAFLVVVVARSRNPSTGLGMWAHVTLVVGLVQMLFYGQLPHQLFLIMAAAAIAYREQTGPVAPAVGRPTPVRT